MRWFNDNVDDDVCRLGSRPSEAVVVLTFPPSRHKDVRDSLLLGPLLTKVPCLLSFQWPYKHCVACRHVSHPPPVGRPWYASANVTFFRSPSPSPHWWQIPWLQRPFLSSNRSRAHAYRKTLPSSCRNNRKQRDDRTLEWQRKMDKMEGRLEGWVGRCVPSLNQTPPGLSPTWNCFFFCDREESTDPFVFFRREISHLSSVENITH